MKKCSTPAYLSAGAWLTVCAMALYHLLTGFNLYEIYQASSVLVAPVLLLVIALPTLLLGVYYLRKAIIRKKASQHIRFF